MVVRVLKAPENSPNKTQNQLKCYTLSHVPLLYTRDRHKSQRSRLLMDLKGFLWIPIDFY